MKTATRMICTPSNWPSRRRARSPVTIYRDPAVTAHSRTRLSSGSSGTASMRRVGLTKVATAAAVSIVSRRVSSGTLNLSRNTRSNSANSGSEIANRYDSPTRCLKDLSRPAGGDKRGDVDIRVCGDGDRHLSALTRFSPRLRDQPGHVFLSQTEFTRAPFHFGKKLAPPPILEILGDSLADNGARFAMILGGDRLQLRDHFGG